ncbi:BatD family protein [Cupriavidus sp. D384]|uniref:BatD family protein n=1 Tax=Cupriavidus sp. D384 TaxID=1538095 RepID=UPI00082C780F|nr:BatD family protein [Cupriavidus sp. D384]
MTMRWLAVLLLFLSGVVQAAAPTVRVRVLGQQPVVAGQSVQIEVTILTPNFFLSAPAFPALQVPGAVVTMPDERGVNSTETIDGTSYAGIRKIYVFTPQTGGDFTLPTPEIHFRWSGDGGKPQDATVTLPAITIHAGGQGNDSQGAAPSASAPSAAPLLPAAPIHIQQTFDQPVSGKDAHLRAGDALVRTITIFAPGTPAMMIEPPQLAAPRGVRQFRADPQLQDGVAASGDEPAGTSGGRRVETITYVFEGSGHYTLPAVSVAWYDPATGKRAQSSAPAVTIDVARAAPGLGLAPSGGTPLQIPDWLDWRWVALLAGVLIGAGYAAWRWHKGWRPHGRRAHGDGPHRRNAPPLPPLNP